MHTILDILTLSTDYLQKKGIQNPRRQAEELLGEALKLGRMGLYLAFDRPLDQKELEQCRQWLKRRGEGEPLQYLCGQMEFLECQIKVNREVLIPRQETEILVDKIVKELKQRELGSGVLWDVCCGSGCIGISLKKHLPQLEVSLIDISPNALAVARENAHLNGVDVTCIQGDFLEPMKGKQANFIVCNPPYVTDKEYEGLEVEVRQFEPKLALVGGPTGLEFYRRLANDLPLVLKDGGKVWMEMGRGQGAALKEIFNTSNWKNVLIEQDWSGHDRFFSLEIE